MVQNTLMKQRRAAIVLLVGVMLVLAVFLGSACLPGFNTSRTTKSPTAATGLETVDEAWNLLFQEYVDKTKLDPEKLAQGAIKGMLEALNDPYTSYLDPEGYQSELHQLQGKFQGIGAHVGMKDNQTIVIGTIPDSPAAKSGVQPGDKILEVDGKSTAGLSLIEVVQLVRGPAGTTVIITLQHEGSADTVMLTLTRAEIKLNTVSWEMKGDVAYIRITGFSDPTDDEFDAAVSGVLQQQADGKAKGLILDLRSNPGGLLDSVVGIASHFFDSGAVVYVVANDGKRSELHVKPGKAQLRLPTIVLVDEFSASGSEVLSGALRDRGVAKLAGHKTFGKGSVNTFHQLPDGGAIYITVSRWETPNGTMIEGKGLEPDFLSDLHGNDMVNWAIDYIHEQSGTKSTAEKLPVPAG